MVTAPGVLLLLLLLLPLPSRALLSLKKSGVATRLPAEAIDRGHLCVCVDGILLGSIALRCVASCDQGVGGGGRVEMG